MIDVAKRITYLRESKNITVNKLATLSGLSQGFVREIELGAKKPTVESLSYICETLEISLSDFFREDIDSIPLDKITKTLTKLNASQLDHLLRFLDSMTDISKG